MKATDDTGVQSAPGDEQRLLDHTYDGIRELDYPLPRWWLMIFYASIVFSIGYCVYYFAGIGPDGATELAAKMKIIEAKRPPEPAATADGDDQVLVAAIRDSGRAAAGKSVYQSKCAACHGQSGEGGIGPNLTDDHWLHGQGRPQDVLEVVRKGVPAKGMPAWAELLKPNEQIEVTAYIRSIHGTRPPGAKAAQGELREFQEL